MQETVRCVCGALMERLAGVVGDSGYALCLYGSAAAGEYASGMSDIDILVRFSREPDDAVCAALLALHEMPAAAGLTFGVVEGTLTGPALLEGKLGRAVYWGTGKQRLEDTVPLSAFDRLLIRNGGRLLHGDDFRGMIPRPSGEELREGVRSTLQTVRTYARQTGESIHAVGWLFDIARGLYTVETGGVASKSAAVRWALEAGLAPDEKTLRKALTLRNAPSLYGTPSYERSWFAGLGPAVQRFADVLEERLRCPDEIG